MVYLLPCYHYDKLEKHLVSYPIFLSCPPWHLYFFLSSFPLLAFIMFSFTPSHNSLLSLFFMCVYVVCVLCVQSLEKLAHPTISSSGVHFPFVGMSEMNISGWNGAERCILTQTRFTRLFFSPSFFLLFKLPALTRSTILTGGKFQTIMQVFSDQHHFTGVSQRDFFSSVPYWHQGLPLKLFIAHHVAYISLKCLTFARWNILVISPMWLSCHHYFSLFSPLPLSLCPLCDISENLRAIKLTEGFILHLSGRDTFGLQLGKPISFGVLFYSLGTSCWWNTLTLWTIVLWKQRPTNMTCWLMLALGGQPTPLLSPPSLLSNTPSPAAPLVLLLINSCSYHCCSHILYSKAALAFCTLN